MFSDDHCAPTLIRDLQGELERNDDNEKYQYGITRIRKLISYTSMYLYSITSRQKDIEEQPELCEQLLWSRHTVRV